MFTDVRTERARAAFPTALASGEATVRVRYEETDRAGVGYHANTFVWFECARTELLRDLGLPYRKLEEDGWLLTVRGVSAEYRRSVYYDECLSVRCGIVSVRGARMRIEYAIFGEDETLRTTGHTDLACLHTETGRPRRLPDFMLARLGVTESLATEKRGVDVV